MSFFSSRAQAIAFRNRWKLVNDAERKELRSTPIEKKFRQMEIMHVVACELGWGEKRPPSQNNWQKLRQKYLQDKCSQE